jgi:hypothetical protein
VSAAPPHGDPDGMRALASTWLTRAEELGTLSGAVTATMAASGFAGPAATRLTGHADALRQEGLAAAGALQALAEELLRDARLVETMNEEALAAQRAEQDAAEAADAAQREAAPPADPAPTNHGAPV